MATQSPASSGFDAAAAATYLRARWEAVQGAVSDPSLLKSERPEVLTDKPPADDASWAASPGTGKRDAKGSSTFLADIWRAADQLSGAGVPAASAPAKGGQ